MEFIIHMVEQYGYLAVALIAFFDHTGMPGGLLMSIGIATTGILDIGTVFLISFLSGFIGDIVFYLIGYYGGRRLLRFLSVRNETIANTLKKAANWFKKYEGSVILWGRFPPVIGKYIMVVSGVFSSSFLKFAGLAFFGGSLMVLIYGVPYYLFGNKLNEFFGNPLLTFYLTIGFLVIYGLGTLIWVNIRKK